MNASRTKRVALIGWPVEHSISPVMHNAAFAALRLDWRYELMPVEPGQVALAVSRLRAEGYQGANVTVPHKQAMVPCLDDLTATARTIGAVNTVTVRGGKLIGDNTDAEGFLVALQDAGVRLRGARVAVVGAGGGARAIVYTMLQGGAEAIQILSRARRSAEALASDLDCRDGGLPRLSVLPLATETLLEAAGSADLLVNATPVGMWPVTGESIWPDDVSLPAHLCVFDLVYNPPETMLLRQARESGAQPIGGLAMLVQQGALAFQAWVGVPAPLSVMREAAEWALGV